MSNETITAPADILVVSDRHDVKKHIQPVGQTTTVPLTPAGSTLIDEMTPPSDVLVVSDHHDVKKHRRPWWKQGTRVLGNPFSSMGLRYCTTCQGEEDTETEAHQRGRVHAWKTWCLRCGSVIGFGLFYNVPLIGIDESSELKFPPAALQWTSEPGQDRR